MNREKQIEEIAKDLCQNTFCSLEEWNKCKLKVGEYCANCRRMAERLYNAGYRKQEWISVDERLPDINDLCLLSMENRITKYRWIVIGYYHTNYDEYVTHWMPLPEAPKMKGGAE